MTGRAQRTSGRRTEGARHDDVAEARLALEQNLRAADYVELVWQEQSSEEEKAALAEFNAEGPELARLIGEFGALLLADHLTAVPDEHADCESAYVVRKPVTVASRYLER
ncbi:hypothetical protein ACFY84_25580 [Streptomyces sp. NPDC012438]|uniref:hypothetical protein n=1 Tax=Streptomyces sp. NPDC012438 TaxID=3364833 RepID=UPI0036ED16F1